MDIYFFVTFKDFVLLMYSFTKLLMIQLFTYPLIDLTSNFIKRVTIELHAKIRAKSFISDFTAFGSIFYRSKPKANKLTNKSPLHYINYILEEKKIVITLWRLENKITRGMTV